MSMPHLTNFLQARFRSHLLRCDENLTLFSIHNSFVIRVFVIFPSANIHVVGDNRSSDKEAK